VGAVVLCTAAALAFLATRTERGPGDPGTSAASGLQTVKLASDAAHDYDPQGDDQESPDATQLAIDANPTTVWDTERYDSDFESLGKQGTGLYVDAGSPVPAKRIDLSTSTPGFTAAIYAANELPDDIDGWTKVGSDTRVSQEQQLPLDTGGARFRYYLLWITELPEQGKATVKELTLRR
jgi:hypothetical protein